MCLWCLIMTKQDLGSKRPRFPLQTHGKQLPSGGAHATPRHATPCRATSHLPALHAANAAGAAVSWAQLNCVVNRESLSFVESLQPRHGERGHSVALVFVSSVFIRPEHSASCPSGFLLPFCTYHLSQSPCFLLSINTRKEVCRMGTLGLSVWYLKHQLLSYFPF